MSAHSEEMKQAAAAAELRRKEQARAASRKIAVALSTKMQQGWTLLGRHCPKPHCLVRSFAPHTARATTTNPQTRTRTSVLLLLLLLFAAAAAQTGRPY
jgi:hypothetical protein